VVARNAAEECEATRSGIRLGFRERLITPAPPMIGTGASLNVAVAGSLVLDRLAGFI
jgi:hypothetical protein